MVRVYKRKTNRGNISRERLLQAVSAVSNASGFMTAAKRYGIDRITSKRFIKRQAQAPAGHNVLTGFSHLAEIKQVLNNANKCQILAYEFATANCITVPTSWQENQKAGLDWFESFRSRHRLSIRIPKATSVARAAAFSNRVVNNFYDNLASVMDQHAFEPQERGELVILVYTVNALENVLPPMFIFPRVRLKIIY